MRFILRAFCDSHCPILNHCDNSDSVAFYCHKTVFAAKSSNYFGGLLLPSPAVYFSLLPSLETGLLPKPNVVQESASPGLLTTIFVTENSVVFNTVLHMIYPGLYVWWLSASLHLLT